MGKLTEADVRLVLRETGRTVKHGRYPQRETTLKDYNVIGPDGEVIGIVSLDMATFERGPRNRMYVTKRWSSPRWFYYVGATRAMRRSIDHETRKRALQGLINDINRRNGE